MKICSKCKEEKDYIFFGLLKSSKDGYRGFCKKCHLDYNRLYKEKNKEKIKEYHANYSFLNKSDKKEYDKIYYNLNKEKKKNITSEYYKNNKDTILQKQINYNINNKDKIKERTKKYRNRIDIKQRRNLREQYRIKNDPIYKLITNIRKFLYTSLKRGNLSKSNIGISTEMLLGCSFDEFKLYLESKFEPWMNWDNQGKYTGNYNETWQIDHIIPLHTANNQEEIILLNKFNNLQPLCSRKNLEKNFIYNI